MSESFGEDLFGAAEDAPNEAALFAQDGPDLFGTEPQELILPSEPDPVPDPEADVDLDAMDEIPIDPDDEPETQATAADVSDADVAVLEATAEVSERDDEQHEEAVHEPAVPASLAPPARKVTASMAPQQRPDAPLALYRRYRPETFAEVIGQDHVTEPLRRALVNNRVNHAYLFSGPRGCGKTSSARILARCLNCEQGPTPEPCGVCQSCRDLARGGSGSIDVIEIDAASHGGVNEARDLRERAFFAPVHSHYKIYIIDEAHMVTKEGFNALLKLVEEPPPHVKFIFATTEPEKVLGTIRSRTHHYPFRLVPPKVLAGYLDELCTAEGVEVDKAVLPLVVRAGAGSVRDSLSVLDQLLGGAAEGGVSYRQATALLGYTPDTLLDEIMDAFAAGDAEGVFASVDKVIEVGQDPRRFAEDLLRRIRDLIIVAAVPEALTSGLVDVSGDQAERLTVQARGLGAGELTRAAEVIAKGLTDMRGTTAPRLHLELMCARVLLPGADVDARGIHARLDRLERRLHMVAEGAGGAAAGGLEGQPGGSRPGGAPGQGDGHAAGPSGRPPRQDLPAGGARERGQHADEADRSREHPSGPGNSGRRPTPSAPGSAGEPVVTGGPADDGWPATAGTGDGSRPRGRGAQSAADAQASNSPSDAQGPRDTSAARGAQGASDARPNDGGPNDQAASTHAPGVGVGSTPDASGGSRRGGQQGPEASGGSHRGDQQGPDTGWPASDGGRPDAGGHFGGSAGQQNAGADQRAGADQPGATAGHLGAPGGQPGAAGGAAAGQPAGGQPGPEAGQGDPGELGTADVRRMWPQILESVKGRRRVTWIVLSQNAQVHDFSGGVLTIALNSAGARESFGRGGSPDILREALIEVLGIAPKVEAIVSGGEPQPPAPGQPPGGRGPGGSGAGVAAAARGAGGQAASAGGSAEGAAAGPHWPDAGAPGQSTTGRDAAGDPTRGATGVDAQAGGNLSRGNGAAAGVNDRSGGSATGAVGASSDLANVSPGGAGGPSGGGARGSSSGREAGPADRGATGPSGGAPGLSGGAPGPSGDAGGPANGGGTAGRGQRRDEPMASGRGQRRGGAQSMPSPEPPPEDDYERPSFAELARQNIRQARQPQAPAPEVEQGRDDEDLDANALGVDELLVKELGAQLISEENQP